MSRHHHHHEGNSLNPATGFLLGVFIGRTFYPNRPRRQFPVIGLLFLAFVVFLILKHIGLWIVANIVLVWVLLILAAIIIIGVKNYRRRSP